ncbi:uncharacterized protein TNIN_69201 [Trichonephila inaurata madagascariensis]|uniref:PiggyBac transposable element-derived protein domain-containing protein n=1 Tax=Trichonephila inaurata madagascariensis TaxID=2747483 RepID=A0A8X7BVX1_9ARAC|nr:uncharacterized protein TNIN_69201 [Trichonephila inaurata madagascariensis]
MPRKGLTIPEALEVFHTLPSDIESDESSLSEAEGVMTAKSSSRENTDIDEEKDDISVPGPSRIFKVTWKNKASSLMHGEKNAYYNNLKSFRLDLITSLVSIGHQKFPDKRFASNFYSVPMKLKFRKHTVSEKDRLKNVGHIPIKCKSRRCAYYYTRAKPHRTR